MSQPPGEEPDAAFTALLEAFRAASERGEAEEQERLGLEALVHAAEWAEKNPNESLRLQIEAHEQEDRRDWAAAEASHQEVLRLAKAGDNAMTLYKAHSDLASFYGLLDRRDLEWEHAHAALAAARASEMDVLTTMALYALAAYQVVAGRSDEALPLLEEILVLAAKDRMHDLERARAHALRARCRVTGGDAAGAEADLDIAWPLLAPQESAALLAGYQSSLATWWEVNAELRQARGEQADAVIAFSRAIEHRRNVSAAPQLGGPAKHNNLALALRRQSLFLLSAGESAAAGAAFAEAQEIRQAIGLPVFDAP